MGFTDHARCVMPANWMIDVSQCWYEWQTLLGSSLAVVAAWFTIRAMKRQMAQVETHRTDEIKRKHNAARIGMPFAVSKVSAWCQDLANLLLEEKHLTTFDGIMGLPYEEFVNRTLQLINLKPVTLDDSVVLRFRDFTETLVDDVDVKHMIELVSRIQILQARWAAFNGEQILAEERLLSLLFDVAVVAYLNESLFNHARGLGNENFGAVGVISFEEVWKGIGGKVFSLIFDRPDVFEIGKINEMLKRRREDGSSPWLEKFEPLQ